jgi:hypothetical protein
MDTCETLGSLVVDRETGERLLLSNWYVLPASWNARVSPCIYPRGPRTGRENAIGVDIAIEHRGVAAILRRVSIPV